VNSSGALRVAARGSALPVSCRKHGSANGNRTCIAPVQSRSVQSNWLRLRSVEIPRSAKTSPRNPDVAARWLRGCLNDRPRRTPAGDHCALTTGSFRTLAS